VAVAAVVLVPTAEAKRHRVLVATHLEIPVPPPGSGTITGTLGIRNCFTGIFSDDKRIKCPRPAVVACTANVSIRAQTTEGPAFGGPLDYFSTTAADGTFSVTVPHYPGDGNEVPVRASPAVHHNTKRLRVECQSTVNFAELS
jgi:hypothetical protein